MTEKEFNHIFLPLAKNIYSFAGNMIGNADDAADITQDVMMKLWDARRELKQIDNVKAWALRITRNHCLDWLKKQKPVYNEEQLLRNGVDANDLLEQIEIRDQAEAVRQIIQTLPGHQREVMILRELEELEFDEIAQITGLEPNNIRVLLSRARSKVREIWSKNSASPNEKA